MRATVEGIEIEGTPEEIAAFLRAKRGQGSNPEPIRSDGAAGDDSPENERFASEKIAYRVLRRRPLSSSQQKLFRVLAAAYPNWTSASSLQMHLKLTPNQLGGVFGGIGRRLSTTDGYVKDSSLIEWVWSADEGEYAYRLPPSVYKAVQRFDP